VARYGGEEFLIVLPGTDASRAGPAANRLCSKIGDLPIVVEGAPPIHVTVSIGVAVGGEDAMPVDPHYFQTSTSKPVVDRLICAADDALYNAKAAGRNRVEVALSPV